MGTAHKNSSPNTKHMSKAQVDAAALKELLKPVQGRIYLGQAIALLSGIVAILPYVVLVRLGEQLIPAATQGVPLDSQRINNDIRDLIAAFSVQMLLYVTALLITHAADLKLRALLQQRILGHLARVPLSWFSQTASGRVRTAVQRDTHTLHTLVAHQPVEVMAAIATPLALAVYTFVLNPWLGLLSIATLPLYALSMGMMTRGMGEKTAQMDEYIAETSARGVEFVDGIEVVKSFGRTGKAHAAFAKSAMKFTDFYWEWCLPLLKSSALGTAVISAPIVMLISLGGGVLLVQGGHASFAHVLVCSLIALIIPLSLDTLTNTSWSYQMAGAAARRIIETTHVDTLDESLEQSSDQAEMQESESGTSAELAVGSAPASAPAPAGSTSALTSAPESPSTQHGVRFESLSYSYTSGGPLALDNISLDLAPGTVTALVGPSGSGKSTLAMMLARFQDPVSGRVLIDGRDVRTFSEEELYSTVAFVLQQAQVLDNSVRENIRLAVPNASDEQIRRAAEQANIWDDIQALPHGLDTMIGEETNLSGGQKQRIVIARALLANAPILILDEATANTDPDTTAEIQKALTRLARNRTVLVIAHTAGAIAGADQIVVMESGRITARGTADQLETNEYWASLQRQARQVKERNGVHAPRAAGSTLAADTASTANPAQEGESND